MPTTRGWPSQRLPTGESPLMAALYRGHHDIVDALVELGADIDVFAAAATGRMPRTRRGARAAGRGQLPTAYDGWTPLHLAAFFGQLEAARLLLEAGADVHAVSRNGLTNTPLHAATAGKHERSRCCFWNTARDANAVDARRLSRRCRIADRRISCSVERSSAAR